jgi:dynein heavy chain
MQSYLEDYNEMSNNPMNLVLFQFAIQHIARICRVIKQPQGNVLLVGVGGSGRQSLAKLGAFIQGFDIYQVCGPIYPTINFSKGNKKKKKKKTFITI